MKNKEIEKILACFKLRGPSLKTRERVLNSAQNAWRESNKTSKILVALRWTWYYAAAAALLLVLNMAYSGIDQYWTSLVYMETVSYPVSMETELEEILAESGFDSELVVRLKTLTAVSNPARYLEAQISRRQAVFLNYM